MCVQNLDDSRGLAIRITYRISLRSSSLWEPRHPLLKVVQTSIFIRFYGNKHTPWPRRRPWVTTFPLVSVSFDKVSLFVFYEGKDDRLPIAD